MIYLLYGEDQFRRQLKLSGLKHELLEPGFESMNLVELSNPSILEVYEASNTSPFGLGEKLIIINDPKFLETKQDDKDVKSLLEGIKELPDRVTLIFNAKKALGTLKLVKEIKKLADETEEYKVFNPWETKQAAAWVIDISKNLDSYNHIENGEEGEQKKNKTSINMETAEFLADYLGTDSSTLFNELSRLSTHSEKISIDLIKQECRPKHDIFKFAKELSSGNSSKANLELNKIIKSKEVNIGLLAALQTTVSRYLKLKLLEQSRLSKDEQAKVLAVSPGRLYYMKQEVGPMKVSTLEKLNNKLAETERKVKQGKVDLETALKLTIAS